MADPKQEVEQLKRELADAKRENAELNKLVATLPKPAPKLPVTSGTFRLTEPHYRLGRLYQAGELITIKDEVPGRTWLPYVEEKESPIPPVAPSPGRPSDKPVA